MRSFEQLKAWEETVISSDDEEALLRQITVSNSSVLALRRLGIQSEQRAQCEFLES